MKQLIATPEECLAFRQQNHTAQSPMDIYALGMVLRVISTGRDPELFPDLATSLMEPGDRADLICLNAIILKACQPDTAQRY